jgi:hypothetical protein
VFDFPNLQLALFLHPGSREYIKELEKQKRGEQAKSDISLSHIR